MERPENPFIGDISYTEETAIWVYDGECWLEVRNSCPTCGRLIEE